MQRALWKGAISFGLVHIPVELFSAEKRHELDLTMLDRKDFAPIGYRRINKKTGKEVAWENIVKGYEYEDDQYVVLSEEDLKRANVKATQTIDIVAFVEAQRIPPTYYEQPYYLAPTKGGDKVYALLRETLRQAGKVGVAQIVIRTKQHLAVLFPMDQVIVLNTLRYHDEIRSIEGYPLPAKGIKAAGLSEKELKMALALVEGMTEDWNPKHFHDSYRDDLMTLIKKKIKTNQTKTITPPDETSPTPPSAKVIDLMALLKRSIETKNTKPGSGAEDETSGKSKSVTRLKTPASSKKSAPLRRSRA
mgnify:CR=1 FL=1